MVLFYKLNAFNYDNSLTKPKANGKNQMIVKIASNLLLNSSFCSLFESFAVQLVMAHRAYTLSQRFVTKSIIKDSFL